MMLTGMFESPVSTACPRCGTSLLIVEERSRARRAWAWFQDGPPVWRFRFECDDCDFSGTDRSFSNLYRASCQVALGRRWREFQFSRSFFPVPRFYAVLFLAGAALGSAVQGATGWPWWWFAVALPLCGWLWTALSIHGSR